MGGLNRKVARLDKEKEAVREEAEVLREKIAGLEGQVTEKNQKIKVLNFLFLFLLDSNQPILYLI